MPRQTINYAMAATLLSQGLNYEQAAQQVGAKDGNSLRVGLFRRGVTLTATRGSEFAIQRAVRVATVAVSGASKALKNDMAGLLQAHTSALGQIKAKPNLKHIMRVGMALEPLVRSAKVVHGWGDEAAQGLIVDVRQADPDTVVDVAASVTGVAERLTPVANQIESSSGDVAESGSNELPMQPS